MARRELIPVIRFLAIEDGGASDSDGGDGGSGNRFPTVLLPIYTGTEFTAGGAVFELITSANAPGVAALGAAGYLLVVATMIADGVLNDFNLFVSAVGGVPPVGVAYGVSYLDPLGVYQTGFAVRLP